MHKLCLWTMVVGVLLAAENTVQAQPKSDTLGASLGLTPDAKSLPLWTKPDPAAVQELAGRLKSLQSAIMLIGDPKVGTGTAFVISRKNRLLATNAHCADIERENGKLLAIRNGTATIYEVDKVWYHPGVRRWKNAQLSLRSQDPADGDVDANSPDVAVLHLADGPELPDEFALATVEETENCFGQPIGMLGYPGHDTDGWPKLGDKAQATLREGIVCRLTDFYGGVSGPPAEMQKLQHSLASWHGFSGSPLFLPNGHVVGLHNSGKGITIERENRHVELAYGVRVDCLWELLAHHKLDNQVAMAADKSKLLLDRYQKPDPMLAKYSQAEELVKEVDVLLIAKKHLEGVAKCNQAIELCPGYSRTYFVRAVTYTTYNIARFSAGTEVGTPVNQEQLKYARLALEDAKTYMEMNPNDAEAILFYCQKRSDVDIIRQVYNEKQHEIAIGVTTKIIEDPSVSVRLRARAFATRAAVKSNVQDNHLYSNQIYADYNEAIRLDPYNPHLWRARGGYDRAGSAQEAADYRRAQQLDEADQLAARAMYLATAKNEKERDGRKAWEMAGKACQVTNYQQVDHLAALAAAYAELGDFQHAVEYGKKSLQVADSDSKDAIRAQLKCYEDRQPFRQTKD